MPPKPTGQTLMTRPLIIMDFLLTVTAAAAAAVTITTTTTIFTVSKTICNMLWQYVQMTSSSSS